MKLKLATLFSFICLFSNAQNLSFELFQKFQSNSSNWDQTIASNSALNVSTTIGDLDQDGVPDIAMAAYAEGAGNGSGAVYICFMKSNGEVRESVEISEGKNGFNYDLNNGVFGVADGSRFGTCIDTIGDIDNDGVVDLAVGAYEDYRSTSNGNCGAVFILRMNTNGTVKAFQRIGEGDGGLQSWGPQVKFGMAVKAIGDIDNDGVNDLAVGAGGYRGIEVNGGAVYVLKLNSDGTVKSESIIAPSGNLFAGKGTGGYFGSDITNMGDLNGDGFDDYAIATRADQVWILFMDANFNVASTQLLGLNSPYISSAFSGATRFGKFLTSIPDLNYDGRRELLISSVNDDFGFGEVHMFYMGSDGVPTGVESIDNNMSGLDLKSGGNFGAWLSYLGDVNKDGYPEFGIGEMLNSDQSINSGTVYMITAKPKDCSLDECVWPGDCNNDGVANMKDIFNIAGSYSTTEPASRRVLPTTFWVGQYGDDWNSSKFGANVKFADTNGDGVVDVLDRQAIYDNYGELQQKTNGLVEIDPNGPLLLIKANKDTVGSADSVEFDIYLGEPTKQAENVYGVAMSLRHNVSDLEGVSTNTADFSDCWLGTDGVDMITFAQPFDDGIDLSMARTDKVNRTGDGHLATVKIITPDNLGEMNPKYLKLVLTDLLIVSYEEDTIVPNVQYDSVVVVKDLTVSISDPQNQGLVVYPNPVGNEFSFQANSKINSIQVFDAFGKLIQEDQIGLRESRVDISNLNPGHYFVLFHQDEKTSYARIIKE